jgi:cation diffusion facilitator family transporter
VRYPTGEELPEAQERANRKAISLEWVSVAYWLSAIVLLYFTLGQSQAMKAAWIEDILGLFPPIAFLVASRVRHRDASGAFPWGFHRAITVAYVVATVALFALGAYILIDSVDKLIRGTHPPIGLVEIFDTQIWLGWLMIAALLYSGIPPLIIGRLKEPLAEELHDKVLFADARMNRADWLTASAAIVGVVGIGFGIWWADSVAAIVIALDILHDGQRYLRESIADLLDDAPKTHDEKRPHPLIDEVRREVADSGWVADAVLRMRENGHVMSADVWVVPVDDAAVADRVEELTERLRDLDWRIADVIVSPVRTIEGAPGELRVVIPPPEGVMVESERPPRGARGIRHRVVRLLSRR